MKSSLNQYSIQWTNSCIFRQNKPHRQRCPDATGKHWEHC